MEGSNIDLLYPPKPIDNAPGLVLCTLKVTYDGGASTPPHRHGEAFVTAVVLEGAIRSRVNDEKEKVFKTGESWTEAPGSYHWISVNASETEKCVFLATFVAPATQTEFVIFDCPACEVVKGGLA